MKNKNDLDSTASNTEKTEAAAQNSSSAMGGKRKIRRIVLFSVLGVALALIAAAAAYIYPAIHRPESLFEDAAAGQTQQPAADNPHLPTQRPDAGTEPRITNILLLGIDQDYKPYARGGGDYHTDSIIVLAVNFDENKVDMISLPRDTSPMCRV
jgi:anionic cell wall polymer biosynthesis LytR-Cps2A-Psr (LCP) family protein